MCSFSRHRRSISSLSEKVSRADKTERMWFRLAITPAVDRNSDDRAPGGSIPAPTCSKNGSTSRVSVLSIIHETRCANTQYSRQNYRPVQGQTKGVLHLDVIARRHLRGRHLRLHRLFLPGSARGRLHQTLVSVTYIRDLRLRRRRGLNLRQIVVACLRSAQRPCRPPGSTIICLHLHCLQNLISVLVIFQRTMGTEIPIGAQLV